MWAAPIVMLLAGVANAEILDCSSAIPTRGTGKVDSKTGEGSCVMANCVKDFPWLANDPSTWDCKDFMHGLGVALCIDKDYRIGGKDVGHPHYWNCNFCEWCWMENFYKDMPRGTRNKTECPDYLWEDPDGWACSVKQQLRDQEEPTCSVEDVLKCQADCDVSRHTWLEGPNGYAIEPTCEALKAFAADDCLCDCPTCRLEQIKLSAKDYCDDKNLAVEVSGCTGASDPMASGCTSNFVNGLLQIQWFFLLVVLN